MRAQELKRPGWRVATPVVVAVALLLAGCADSFFSERPAKLSETPTPAGTMSPEVAREHQRILAAYGGAYHDAKLEAMANRTVERLVAASERPDLHYKVTILNSPAVNAFALPSGQLYVTRGLFALANDNSELASVLAHEMAHVIARHAAIREEQARQASVVSQVANDLLADPQMGALALAKSKITMASFSRQQEFEADGIGVGISARAGFDPYGATRFLTDMGRNADLKSSGVIDLRSLDFLSTHPATPDRARNAQTNARQFSAPGTGERDKAEYLATINGIVYGEDPNDGVIRRRRFLHPRLGFTFTAPEGFALENTAQAVFGVKDSGGEALRLDVVHVPTDQTLPDYLRSGWIDNIDDGSLEETTVNGLPAATATASGDPWQFRLYAIRVGGDVYRFVFAAKQRTPQTQKTFRDTIASFRRMTPAEIKSVKPLRIKVVTVRRGDTVEQLASRMVVPNRPIERFRVLNGLDPKQGVKPGQRIKIVSD